MYITEAQWSEEADWHLYCKMDVREKDQSKRANNVRMEDKVMFVMQWKIR